MLRPTPTSITLSQDDVAGVEKQMDMYLGLLKQGFNRDDIIRYFEEHKATSQPAVSPDVNLRAPSTVELALLRPDSPVGHVSPSPSASAKNHANHDASEEAEDTNSTPLATLSPTERMESTQSHAPRRSSILRFGQNASPIRSEDQSDSPTFVPPVPTYRPRTDTYPYSPSEISESDLLPEPADGSLPPTVTVTRGPPMRAEAKDFVPRKARLTPGALRNGSPPSSGNSTPAIEDNGNEHSPTLIVQDLTPTPAPTIPGEDGEDSITLPPVPAPEVQHRPLPYNLRSRAKSQALPTLDVAARTPMRPPSSQLDGAHVFSVYNDTLSATAQPQTPADIARPHFVTERHYTAPAGRLASPVRRFHRGSWEDAEEGVASPTTRAMANQSRRARELERRVRAEAGRQYREHSTVGLPVAEQDDLQQEEARLAALSLGANGRASAVTSGSEGWRHGLEDDRAGMENWEFEEAALAAGRNPRVLSGNARPFWPL